MITYVLLSVLLVIFLGCGVGLWAGFRYETETGCKPTVLGCDDTFGDHHCTLKIGHVGLHENRCTRWWGFVEFPYPSGELPNRKPKVLDRDEMYCGSGEVIKVVAIQ